MLTKLLRHVHLMCAILLRMSAFPTTSSDTTAFCGDMEVSVGPVKPHTPPRRELRTAHDTEYRFAVKCGAVIKWHSYTTPEMAAAAREGMVAPQLISIPVGGLLFPLTDDGAVSDVPMVVVEGEDRVDVCEHGKYGYVVRFVDGEEYFRYFAEYERRLVAA